MNQVSHNHLVYVHGVTVKRKSESKSDCAVRLRISSSAVSPSPASLFELQ